LNSILNLYKAIEGCLSVDINQYVFSDESKVMELAV